MVYTKNGAESFCSLSDSRRHDAPAIWAHLEPILEWITKDHPYVKNLIFFSDGPTTQYRNRVNMFLMSDVPMRMGFASCSWHFWEAGHGKGAPDGVGAAVKRRADKFMSNGKVITNADSLINELGGTLTNELAKCESKIKLFSVQSEHIEVIQKRIHDVKEVKGIMKIHQVIANKKHVIEHRELSCYCSRPDGCACFSMTTVTFDVPGINSGTITVIHTDYAPYKSHIMNAI